MKSSFSDEHLVFPTRYPIGIEIVRAEGVYLYDKEGKAYLDLISGIAVSALGHKHPRIWEAVQKQIASYAHVMVYGDLLLSPQRDYAKALCGSLPKGLDKVFFISSGSEAVELGLKLAKKHSRRSRLIAFEGAYHGSTHGALSVTGSQKLRMPFMPLLPDVLHLRFGVLEDLEKLDSDVACVLIEPVQAENGIRSASLDYFKELRQRTQDLGILLIVDEIQTGLGRTGYVWAFQELGFVPDLLLSAKALGGGFPLGAVIGSAEIMEKIAQKPSFGHISTFGGHPLSCAAGHAVLQIVQSDSFLTEVRNKANLFREQLSHHKAIREFRQSGLLMAIELHSKEDLHDSILPSFWKKGLMVDGFLFCPGAIRLAPPLILSSEEILSTCQKIKEILDPI
ncbi:MAG: aspartate aminotransferase family protein [Cytophagales bacterium]|nr:aspartate aminotransferase family protein [Cytophagales bacterium]